MGGISRTEATLRISGDELVADEISGLLGHPPTFAQTKGDLLVVTKLGAEREARFGMWRLDADVAEPGDLESQIFEILDGLSDDLSVWRALGERYKVDLFCGLFVRWGNEGFCIQPVALKALGVRGILIDFDVYALEGDEAEG